MIHQHSVKQPDIKNKLYTPPNLIIKSKDTQKIKALILGEAGQGKSFAAKTFPNPVFLDYDNNLQHDYFNGTQTIPAYDKNIQKSVYKAHSPRRFIFSWIADHGSKLSSEQTLVIDSQTGLSDQVKIELDALIPNGRDGKPDGFWFWNQWSVFWCAFTEEITKKLDCNLVVISHAKILRDSETNRIVSIDLLMKGQDFTSRIPSFYNNVFYQKRIPKGFNPLIDLKPDQKVDYDYMWQIADDKRFTIGRTTIDTKNAMVPATYESFK